MRVSESRCMSSMHNASRLKVSLVKTCAALSMVKAQKLHASLHEMRKRKTWMKDSLRIMKRDATMNEGSVPCERAHLWVP